MNTNHTVVIRPRTLGLPVSAEVALVSKAYENYATAVRLAVSAHNVWRRHRHLKGTGKDGVWRADRADRHPVVKAALTKATKAAMLREDAKAQYRAARKNALAAR